MGCAAQGSAGQRTRGRGTLRGAAACRPKGRRAPAAEAAAGAGGAAVGLAAAVALAVGAAAASAGRLRLELLLLADLGHAGRAAGQCSLQRRFLRAGRKWGGVA